jgi:hypothetical protein
VKPESADVSLPERKEGEDEADCSESLATTTEGTAVLLLEMNGDFSR